MELNERIKLARTRAGLKQHDVAKHFGISRPTVAQWEAGSHRPDQDRFAELSTLFHVTLDWLMQEVGPGPTGPDGKVSLSPSSAPQKFVRSKEFKFYIQEWREFMGTKVESAARSCGLDPDGYLAHETYPINFNLGQVAALAAEFGIRGDQFWFPPPKARKPVPTPSMAAPRKIRLRRK